MKTKTLIGLFLIVLVAGGSFLWRSQQQEKTASPIVFVTLPATLSASAQTGRQSFDANCASCHGQNAAGQEGTAPPLIHKIYEPSHHGDGSFQRAVASGVRAHHWPFG
ncbi:MAG: c-type cytochrome, partial [Sneathiella sp.]